MCRKKTCMQCNNALLDIILLWCSIKAHFHLTNHTSSFVFLDKTLSQSPIMLRTAAKYARPTKIQNQTRGLYHFMYSILRSPPIKYSIFITFCLILYVNNHKRLKDQDLNILERHKIARKGILWSCQVRYDTKMY